MYNACRNFEIPLRTTYLNKHAVSLLTGTGCGHCMTSQLVQGRGPQFHTCRVPKVYDTGTYRHVTYLNTHVHVHISYYTRFRAVRENIARVPGMYFHESEGRVKMLPAQVQYSVLQGNKCNKRFILYSQLQQCH